MLNALEIRAAKTAFITNPARFVFLIGLARGPIDLQRRIARQKGERLARRARSHGGFSAIDQSLDAGFKPCFTKITP